MGVKSSRWYASPALLATSAVQHMYRIYRAQARSARSPANRAPPRTLASQQRMHPQQTRTYTRPAMATSLPCKEHTYQHSRHTHASPPPVVGRNHPACLALPNQPPQPGPDPGLCRWPGQPWQHPALAPPQWQRRRWLQRQRMAATGAKKREGQALIMTISATWQQCTASRGWWENTSGPSCRAVTADSNC